MKTALVVMMVASLGVAGLAGCSERDQTALYENGKYRGKPDSRAWDSAAPGYGAVAWEKGDRASWQRQVRARQDIQNENHRIDH